MANAYAELEREFHGQGDSNDVEDMNTGEVQEYLSEQGVDFEAMATNFGMMGDCLMRRMIR